MKSLVFDEEILLAFLGLIDTYSGIDLLRFLYMLFESFRKAAIFRYSIC